MDPMSSSLCHVSLPKLNKVDYNKWSIHMRALLDKFENVVCAIKESKDLEDMMIDDLLAGHFAKECKFLKRVEETTNLVTEEDVNVDGIVMMAYEVDVNGIVLMANKEVVPKTNTTWYLNTGVGLEIRQDNYGIYVSQETYAKEILKKFDMAECNPVATPMAPGTKFSKFEGGYQVDASNYQSVVGILRYLTCTRPDITYSVVMVSQFMEDPRYSHWKAVKRILRYLKGKVSLGLFYSSSTKYKLLGYFDSDWHGDVDDLKSTSGYVFYFGVTTFTWASKKQPIVTMSTYKADYVEMSWCVSDAIWLIS
ncbi:hypothetical protein Tco_0164386 [Tanacetum coccineum]